VDPSLGSASEGPSVDQVVEDLLGERIEALASWIQDLDAQVRATLAAGDEKALKELRKALEMWSKRDPKFEERLTERVDVLADRLATLSSTVNTTAAARASSEGELAALRRELEQETAKLHATFGKSSSPDLVRELEELRQTVAKLDRGAGRRKAPDATPPNDLENLGVRIDMLATTVATTAAGLAGREGELASLRRSLDDLGERIEEVAARPAPVQDAKALARLDAGVADVAKKVLATTKALAERDRFASALKTRLEEQGTRLETVVTAVNQSHRDETAALADLDARVAALGERLDAGDPRHDALENGLEGLSSQIATLAAERAELDAKLESLAGEARAAARALEDRFSEAEPRHDDLDARLEALAAQVSDASSERAAGTDAIAELRRRAEDADERFEATLAELRARVAAIPEPPSADELAAQVAPLAAQVDELEAKLQSLGATTSESARALERRIVEAAAERRESSEAVAGLREQAQASNDRFETALAELRARVASIPDAPSRDELSAEVAPLAARVDALASSFVEAEARIAGELEQETLRAARLEHRIGDVDGRLEEVARSTDALATQAEAAKAAWELERAWVREQMDALVSAVADTPSRSDVEPLVGDLTTRLQEVVSEQAALTTELARARESAQADAERLQEELRALPEPPTPVPPSEDAKLKTLLTAFADRIDAMEQGRPSIATEAAEAAAQRVEEILPLVEGLRRRVDESDRRLEELGSTVEQDAGLDDLRERLQELEERPTPAPPPPALPGDGRFRVELRALELRMQHAEEAARETREAVLVQLERLGSRVEWRLQQLETADPKDDEGTHEAPLGEVVPLRGSAET
jgi:chromosome segregation ATPase